MNSRRQFLRGLGGFSLALPLLPSLLSPDAAAQVIGAQSRYLQIIGHFGVPIGGWNPRLAATMQITNGVYHQPLSSIAGPISAVFGTPFDTFRNKMSIIQGLDCLDTTRPNGKAVDKHSRYVPTCAAAEKPEINEDNSPATFPYSIDAILAESNLIYPTAPKLGAVRVAPYHTDANPYSEFGSFSHTSKSGAHQIIRSEMNMMNVYNQLFMGQAPGGAPLSRRKIVTDLVLEDYKRVMGSRRIAADDKIRLDNWMTFLTEASQRLGIGTTPVLSCNSVAPLGTPTTGEMYESNAIDMIVAAFACGATRIGSWSIMHHASDAKASNEDRHTVGHDSTHAPVSTHATVTKWTADRVAELMRKMDAIVEPNGKTLLDNTIVYFTNEDSTGSHTHTDMPIMIAGGAGKLRMGQHIDFRPRPLFKTRNAPENDHKDEDDHGGQYPQYVGRPLNSLLVTFFQAMGLQPADYQKFGRTGFGEYERHKLIYAPVYAPFKTAAVRNTPLPFLYLG